MLRWPYHENDRAQAERETRGHIKVVTNRRGRILGATIVGAAAGELITTWTLAISRKAQYSRRCRYHDAVSDLVGDWKAGRDYLFHAQFEEYFAASRHRLVAPIRLEITGLGRNSEHD